MTERINTLRETLDPLLPTVDGVLGFQLPLTLGDFEVAQELLFEVAQPRRLFEVLALHDLVIGLLDLLDLRFEVDDLLRHVDVRQVNPRA